MSKRKDTTEHKVQVALDYGRLVALVMMVVRLVQADGQQAVVWYAIGMVLAFCSVAAYMAMGRHDDEQEKKRTLKAFYGTQMGHRLWGAVGWFLWLITPPTWFVWDLFVWGRRARFWWQRRAFIPYVLMTKIPKPIAVRLIVYTIKIRSKIEIRMQARVVQRATGLHPVEAKSKVLKWHLAARAGKFGGYLDHKERCCVFMVSNGAPFPPEQQQRVDYLIDLMGKAPVGMVQIVSDEMCRVYY